ncbi:MAG TPA: hypothetical protein VK960_06775 [Acidimicrobiia bacterium]|nr:hypothetical protein [Acidimicrobiia bacterium]
MLCLSCADAARDDLCTRCAGTLSPAPEQHLGSVLVRAAFVHEGAARRLVHRLKYEALEAAAGPLARAMAQILPGHAQCLVPVPRVVARRWRYGVDSGVAVTAIVARLTGLPVVHALRPAFWVARRAGQAGGRRGIPRFTLTRHPGEGAILVDDVVTTGTTLCAAARVATACHAVTATSALRGTAVRP